MENAFVLKEGGFWRHVRTYGGGGGATPPLLSLCSFRRRLLLRGRRKEKIEKALLLFLLLFPPFFSKGFFLCATCMREIGTEGGGRSEKGGEEVAIWKEEEDEILDGVFRRAEKRIFLQELEGGSFPPTGDIK